MIRIYGTIYNNRKRLPYCLKSLNSLKAKFYIIDNYSIDGTFEYLRNIKNIMVKKEKCNRGKERQLAMEMAIADSKDNDPIFYVDFDTIYSRRFIKLIKDIIPRLRDN